MDSRIFDKPHVRIHAAAHDTCEVNAFQVRFLRFRIVFWIKFIVLGEFNTDFFQKREVRLIARCSDNEVIFDAHNAFGGVNIYLILANFTQFCLKKRFNRALCNPIDNIGSRPIFDHVYPEWCERNFADIRRRDVHELLDGIIAKGKTGTASDVRKHLSRLFNWAVDREIITDSPLSGLKRKDLQYKADAGRALTDVELRAIWRAADRMTIRSDLTSS